MNKQFKDKKLFAALFFSIALWSMAAVLGADSARPVADLGTTESVHNTLTAAEKTEGWKLLFDGKTATGWRGFRREKVPADCWTITEGMLHRLRAKMEGNEKKECGDLITTDQYSEFEFQLQWKIEPRGNSGIKYLIREDRPPAWEKAYMDYHIETLKKRRNPDPAYIARITPERWKYSPMGFEFQLIDDRAHPDARNASIRITGALYDLLAPSSSPASPAGDFNDARIVVRGKRIQHWVNGTKVLEFDQEGSPLKEAIANSKFNQMEGFGSVTRGHIALQDHGDQVWFRDLKIRELRGN